MSSTTDYTPPQVWTWNKENGGRFANINRPIAGPTHDKELPVGRHPLQLYSLGTPNGQKVTVMLEELLALGPHRRRVRRLADQDRRGRAVRLGLRGGQSQLQDSGADRPQRAEADPRVRIGRDPDPPRREVRRVPAHGARDRARSACRGCSGRWAARLTSAAASATSTPMRRSRSNTPSTASPWRSSGSSTCSTGGSARAKYLAGDDYTIADMAVWPWYGGLAKGLLYDAGEFLAVTEYKNVQRWTDTIGDAPGGEARPDRQPHAGRSGEPAARAPRRQRLRAQDAGQGGGQDLRLSPTKLGRWRRHTPTEGS